MPIVAERRLLRIATATMTVDLVCLYLVFSLALWAYLFVCKYIIEAENYNLQLLVTIKYLYYLNGNKKNALLIEFDLIHCSDCLFLADKWWSLANVGGGDLLQLPLTVDVKEDHRWPNLASVFVCSGTSATAIVWPPIISTTNVEWIN